MSVYCFSVKFAFDKTYSYANMKFHVATYYQNYLNTLKDKQKFWQNEQ